MTRGLVSERRLSKPFLVRWTFALDGDEPEHDEMVIADLSALFAIEKGLTVLGRHGTIRVEFDPPLVPVDAPVT